MDANSLYNQIAAAVRQDILEGKLKPGERLPPLREVAQDWSCTLGTAQRAYRQLADQGLVISRAGQGTHVVETPPVNDDAPLRKANLVHQAERFLLEVLTTGYSSDEVEAAMRLALDRWRAIAQQPQETETGVLRFAGSHDPALAWLAAHFPEIVPQFSLQLGFSGSLGGLIALAEGKADLAGCHLWDRETDSYNEPFVRRLLPSRRVALVALAQRRLGLIVQSGNPLGINGLADLARPEMRFANRQSGSGTRVWLDTALEQAGIPTNAINGYAHEHLTHSEVALAVAEGRADVGLGLETAALLFGLDYIHLTLERYDLVIPAENMETPCVERLVEWLQSAAARRAIEALGGYETGETGKTRWV
jgi:molybdate-binding protein/DNA-binding transcriptional regulator YhcF (GntR family)